jgi:hypothetical protein
MDVTSAQRLTIPRKKTKEVILLKTAERSSGLILFQNFSEVKECFVFLA